ncbi:MAG: hypothetical protein U5R46_09880 [Gammaproteobacteria bacterium]|nr:hypothetical protein [Gammaproteobacteria bacterium]
MTLETRFRIAVLFTVLVAVPGTMRAELGRDIHIQESGEIRIEVDRQVFEEFSRLFALGYPPATVMMHAVSTGMSISDILYIAVKSHPDRAQEFYDTAESLLPALPGWVCQADDERGRYTREVNLPELGEDPGVRRVAELYVNEDRRVVPFPDWSEGRVHMEASVEELAGLVSDEQWYVPGDDDGTPRTAPNRPVFVSVYKHNGEIVVDSGVDRIRRAREQGVDRLPVVLVYNNALQRPVSSFQPDVTLRELANEFYDAGIELTAVPEWQVGDHHKRASAAELREVVDVPARDDIPAQRWSAAEQEIRANGMALPGPLLLTLVRSGRGRAWVDDPVALAVASDLGVADLPVVLFYHRLDRRACGQPSNCEEKLCEAATAAGASAEICESGGTTARAGAGASRELLPDGNMALGLDPRLYDGLSYTQNQCTAS